jgi:hypothetical protein
MLEQKKQQPYKAAIVFRKEPPPPDDPGDYDRFGILLKESQKFCKRVGLQKDLIPKILKTDGDWAFILKVDALHESAAKHIVRHGLQIKLLKQTFRNGGLDNFIDSLPMNGRTSVLKLLEASALPEEELRFVEVTRLGRNAYAHKSNMRISPSPNSSIREGCGSLGLLPDAKPRASYPESAASGRARPHRGRSTSPLHQFRQCTGPLDRAPVSEPFPVGGHGRISFRRFVRSA